VGGWLFNPDLLTSEHYNKPKFDISGETCYNKPVQLVKRKEGKHVEKLIFQDNIGNKKRKGGKR